MKTEPGDKAPAKTTPEPVAVPQELDRSALDFLVRKFFGGSWNDARKKILRGEVLVDGMPLKVTDAKVLAGKMVSLGGKPQRIKKGPELEREMIAHVDPHVIVIRKPAGISTVRYPGEEIDYSLEELVIDYLSRRKEKGTRNVRATVGVVHRIDKETSGLVMFTRSWAAKQSLGQQFRFHTTHRRYIAIADGHVRATTIRSHLVENRGDGVRGSQEAVLARFGRKIPGEGKLAVTHVRVIESHEKASLVECALETGRTHQIRIHLSELGHPILGDRVYSRGFPGVEDRAPRMMLHAAELGFIHPVTEREMRFEEPMPADMKKCWEKIVARAAAAETKESE